LSYTAFSHLWDTYTKTEEKWRSERDVKQTMSQVDSAIKLSYQVTLDNIATEAAIKKEAEKRYLFYNTTEKNLYFIDYDPKTEKHLTAVKLNEFPVNVIFTSVDSSGTLRKDMLFSTISSGSGVSTYSLNSGIFLANIADSVKTTKAADSYNVVCFSVAKDGVLTINSADLPDACFIATAAYGDIDAPNVTLLRIFRDEVLAKSKVGLKIIHTYYRYSPYWANIISKNSALRFVARAFLTPFIAVAAVFIYPILAIPTCIFMIMIVCFYRRRHKSLK
ncbi:MAG: CFI-box-CTERM domain-containing protein, partial [Oscillospiraceae bacterium]